MRMWYVAIKYSTFCNAKLKPLLSAQCRNTCSPDGKTWQNQFGLVPHISNDAFGLERQEISNYLVRKINICKKKKDKRKAENFETTCPKKSSTHKRNWECLKDLSPRGLCWWLAACRWKVLTGTKLFDKCSNMTPKNRENHWGNVNMGCKLINMGRWEHMKTRKTILPHLTRVSMFQKLTSDRFHGLHPPTAHLQCSLGIRKWTSKRAGCFDFPNVFLRNPSFQPTHCFLCSI